MPTKGWREIPRRGDPAPAHGYPPRQGQGRSRKGRGRRHRQHDAGQGLDTHLLRVPATHGTGGPTQGDNINVKLVANKYSLNHPDWLRCNSYFLTIIISAYAHFVWFSLVKVRLDKCRSSREAVASLAAQISIIC